MEKRHPDESPHRIHEGPAKGEASANRKEQSVHHQPLHRQCEEAHLIEGFNGYKVINRKGEWGQNLPPKLEIVDDIWGEKTHLPKRKQKSQNPEIKIAGDGDRDKGLVKAKRQRCQTSGLVENQPTSGQKLPRDTDPQEAIPLKAKLGPGEIGKVKTWADLRANEGNSSILQFFNPATRAPAIGRVDQGKSSLGQREGDNFGKRDNPTESMGS